MHRRRMLVGSGAALTTIIAGCAGDSNDETGNSDDTGSGNENGNGDDNGENPDEATPESDNSNGDDEDESVDEPDSQSFSGSGATVEDGVRIVGDLTVIDAEHDGDSNFQVSLVNDSEFDDMFVNEIGNYDGETANLIDGGEYMLDVEADGDWEIEVRQPRAASGDSLPQSLDGDGPEVLGPIEFSGTHVAVGEHHGQSNFQVQILPPEGDFGEVVFNEIGQYDGEGTVSFDGVGWVAVQADGEWALDLE